MEFMLLKLVGTERVCVWERGVEEEMRLRLRSPLERLSCSSDVPLNRDPAAGPNFRAGSRNVTPGRALLLHLRSFQPVFSQRA